MGKGKGYNIRMKRIGKKGGKERDMDGNENEGKIGNVGMGKKGRMRKGRE